MKFLFILFFLSLISCTKQVQAPQEECKATTFYIDQYDANGKYQGTVLSWHSCKTCGSELEAFKKYPVTCQLCGSNNILRLVIGKDSCNKK